MRYDCVSSEMLLCERSQICTIFIIRTNILYEKVLIEFFSTEFTGIYGNALSFLVSNLARKIQSLHLKIILKS